MNDAAVYGFAESAAQAQRLAGALGVSCHAINVRYFPDGESLVQVSEPASTAFLYRSLDHPNPKLMELMLAASALRDQGVARIVLVAPYLAYMRQDTAFHAGEAVSQRVMGRFIAEHFDGLVTVDPHLHRTSSLDTIMPGLPALAISAAETIAEMLRTDVPPDTILIGPDSESRPWVERVAAPLKLEVIIGAKHRTGDRAVSLVLPGIERVRDRSVVLVDDLVSSGTTLLSCAAQLHAARVRSVEAVATHSLASTDDLARMFAGGIARLRSTDTIPNTTAAVAIAPALAAAIEARFRPHLYQK